MMSSKFKIEVGGFLFFFCAGKWRCVNETNISSFSFLFSRANGQGISALGWVGAIFVCIHVESAVSNGIWGVVRGEYNTLEEEERPIDFCWFSVVIEPL